RIGATPSQAPSPQTGDCQAAERMMQMCTSWLRPVMVLCAATLLGSTTQTQAQEFSRFTAVTRAIDKTQDSIVTIKVVKGRSEIVGTGVIVDERGYVVTNHHVVNGATRLTVVLSDGTELTTKVLSKIPSHDLAILQVTTPRALKALPL